MTTTTMLVLTLRLTMLPMLLAPSMTVKTLGVDVKLLLDLLLKYLMHMLSGERRGDYLSTLVVKPKGGTTRK